MTVVVSRTLTRGGLIARAAQVLARSGTRINGRERIAQEYPDSPELLGYFARSGEVGALTTAPGEWSSAPGAVEFLGLLAPLVALDRFGTGIIPSLRRAPFHVPSAVQSAAGV